MRQDGGGLRGSSPRAVPRAGCSSAEVREAGLKSFLVNGLHEQTVMVGSFAASGSRLGTGRAANVNIVIMHQFSGGTVAAVQNWLRNPASRVSYHFGVGRNGEIRQWVDTRNTAWATGAANARSIAVGCEGTNQQFTAAQLDACGRIIRWARGAHTRIPGGASGVGWHRQFMQTNCPGNPMIAQIPELVRRAGATPAPRGTRHVADGTRSLDQVARSRNTRPQVIVNRSFRGEPTAGGSLNSANRSRMAEYLHGGATRTMPRGLVYWTSSGGGQLGRGRHPLARPGGPVAEHDGAAPHQDVVRCRAAEHRKPPQDGALPHGRRRGHREDAARPGVLDRELMGAAPWPASR
jgi:hypothetical protein